MTKSVQALFILTLLSVSACGGGSKGSNLPHDNQAIGDANSDSTASPSQSIGSISLLAGDIGGSGNIDGDGQAARFYSPFGAASDDDGNLYIADGTLIRKITPAGMVRTIAGAAGIIGTNDGNGPEARFNDARALAVDKAGTVYVADSANFTIRKITAAGKVTTLAGTPGVAGASDGQGSAAHFSFPSGIAVDDAGNVYVADKGNSTIRTISPDGMVSTLAGAAGALGSADGDGPAARFRHPTSVAVDAARNVYVADGYSYVYTLGDSFYTLINSTIRKIDSNGAVTTVAGTPGTYTALVDGTGAAARLGRQNTIAVDRSGNVYVVDSEFRAVRRVSPAGVVTTLVGTSETADFANPLAAPAGIAIDMAGNIYVTDTRNAVIQKMTPDRVITTFAGRASKPVAIQDDPSDVLFANPPTGIAIARDDNVFVTDIVSYDKSRIRKIAPTGEVTSRTIKSMNPDGSFFGEARGMAADENGNLFVAAPGAFNVVKIAPDGSVSEPAGAPHRAGYQDGPPGNALFSTELSDIAVDKKGNIYVADAGNFRIRRIAPDGVVSTIPGTGGASPGFDDCTSHNFRPRALAIDNGGNVYATDSIKPFVCKITPEGAVSILAGSAGRQGAEDGVGSAASFSSPSGLAVDAQGNVYVADRGNGTVRMISADGKVTTIAGKAGSFGIALGNPPGSLDDPNRVAVDSTGNFVYVTTRHAVLKIRLK